MRSEKELRKKLKELQKEKTEHLKNYAASENIHDADFHASENMRVEFMVRLLKWVLKEE